MGFQFVAVACIERSVGDYKYNSARCSQVAVVRQVRDSPLRRSSSVNPLSSSIAWGRRLGDRKK